MSLFDALDNEAGFRGDAETASMFFARELEAVKAQSYDVLRAPLRAFDLIPMDNTEPAGAETVVYEQYDMTGLAKIIADYADDLPRADVKGKEFVAFVRSVGNSYGYSLQEIRAAQMAGKPLAARKASAAVRSMREEWNRIAFYGDANHNLQGWLTNANIPLDTAEDDGEAGATEWTAKTPAQILRDLNELANGVIERTNGAEQPDTLVLPIERYTFLTTTDAGTGTDTTIAQYFLANSPFINSIEWSNEITAANRTANIADDRYTGEIAMVYRRDPGAMWFEMPVTFEELPIQERNLEFVVPCHSRVAGTIIPFPLSQAVLEGI